MLAELEVLIFEIKSISFKLDIKPNKLTKELKRVNLRSLPLNILKNFIFLLSLFNLVRLTYISKRIPLNNLSNSVALFAITTNFLAIHFLLNYIFD